jgi:hypothetical protein
MPTVIIVPADEPSPGKPSPLPPFRKLKWFSLSRSNAAEELVWPRHSVASSREKEFDRSLLRMWSGGISPLISRKASSHCCWPLGEGADVNED